MNHVARIDRRQMAAPQVYRYLHGQIVGGELRPGQALSENAVAEQLNVSRTPVREAFIRLADEKITLALFFDTTDTGMNDAARSVTILTDPFYELLKINLAEDVNDRYFSAREIKADLEKRRVTREVACPKCKAVNNVREPYCAKCAEPLTDVTPPCHHCGKTNRMGSRCCIHCGNRLR